MYRIILAAIAFVIFATPSYAWIRVSLEECFQAMERGTLIKAYTNSDWDTQHLWFYYNRSL